MRTLLLDVGNTFAKYVLVDNGNFGEIQRIPTKAFGLPALKKVLPRNSNLLCCFCTVVPWAADCIRHAIPHAIELTWFADIDIQFDYPSPETLGADRIANVVACKTFYRVPAIIVDVGTAATFDVLDESGRFCGGAIAPGFELMTKALAQNTAKLPAVEPNYGCQAIGKSTVEALQAGVSIGLRGTIREIVQAISEEQFSGKKPFILGAGGAISHLAASLPIFDAIEPNLPLRGLYAFAKKRFPSL